MVTRLAIPEAARVLGISIPTVKRRLKSGVLHGEQEPTPSGFRWVVMVESPESPAESSPGAPPETPSGDSGESPSESPSESPQMALETMRAAGMASYTRALVEPLYARLEAQAERIGHLEEQLAAALATNGQAKTQNAAPEWPERRSWWQRLVWS